MVDALGFAIDESNHGVDHEVFVMLCSDFGKDFEPYKTSKKRRVTGGPTERRLLEDLELRDFRYLFVDRVDYETYGNLNLFVTVARRLASQFTDRGREKKSLALYVDGKLKPSQIANLSKGVSIDYGLPLRSVGVLPMPKKKRKRGKPLPSYPIVPLLSMADTAANYIMTKDSRRSDLGDLFSNRRIDLE